MRKMVMILGLILVLLISGCSSASSKVIGEVNGEKITQGDYDKRVDLLTASYKAQQQEVSESGSTEVQVDEAIVKQIKEAAFQQLVMHKVLMKETQAQGLAVTDEDVDKALLQFKTAQESAGGSGAYEKVLTQLHLSEADLKAELKIDLLRTKLQDKAASQTQVADKDAQDYYDNNKDMFTQPAGMQVSHILVATEAEANDVIKQLQGGANFAELAKKVSSCPSSAQGGDLGVMNESTPMVQEFKDAALALAPGQMTLKPVKTQFGYHVIKAVAKKDAETVSFQEIKADIVKQLQSQAADDYLQNLYDSAQVNDLRQK